MGSIGIANDNVDRNKLYDIEFTYASFSGKKQSKVAFSAFVTDFSDSFSQGWSSQAVYGKPDSIETYQNTKRSISLSWDVPSVGPNEGYLNMVKLETLIKMLYPVYGKVGDVSTIKRPPILRLKFANFIVNPKKPSRGLLGHVQGFVFRPDLSVGYYTPRNPIQMEGAKLDKDVSKNISLIPKTYKMSCTFIVLHESDLGYNTAGKFGAGDEFPYGFTDKEGKLKAVANKAKVSLGESGNTGPDDPVLLAQLAQILNS